MGQLALLYPAGYLGRQVFQQRLEVLRACCQHLGLKEVAFELDCSGSQLSDSLNERDRKRWACEWLDVVKQMLLAKRDEIALDLYRQLRSLDAANDPDDEPLTSEEEHALDRAVTKAKRKVRR
jgi:hypothetical protein